MSRSPESQRLLEREPAREDKCAKVWGTLDRMTLLLGMSLLLIGATIVGSLSDIAEVAPRGLAVATVGAGGVLLGVGVLGCYHTDARERSGCWRWYALAHIVIFSVLVGIGIQSFVYGSDMNGMLDEAWTREYAIHPELLELLEKRLVCCGYAKLNDRAVPGECSVVFGGHRPCRPPVLEIWKESLDALKVLTLSVVAIETAGFVFALVWAVRLRRRRALQTPNVSSASSSTVAPDGATAHGVSHYAATGASPSSISKKPATEPDDLV
ncbi:Tetraspanin family-domain-containing protein [Thamnocephalis sphaerospora]|uniref:Tetraspanin family-domain-containing protein n=1 Tax=Thamnocephalis sphaerospora TaxID=78915 RepID=A0A4P9XI16_9FUNG|nr:Tetraspanin family-domain-containing protein [Thamnocephalis sphaerospora]|eukprot:RKP05276.1 Tetraspanin family-domain-containing protein [Thamnocephalis sphaerospora]